MLQDLIDMKVKNNKVLLSTSHYDVTGKRIYLFDVIKDLTDDSLNVVDYIGSAFFLIPIKDFNQNDSYDTNYDNRKLLHNYTNQNLEFIRHIK